ncbi:MAG: transglutaminase family protein [Alphaproteobacteria bacterium]
MRLHVRHQTAYHYSRPIAYAIQVLRLTPQPHEGLSVLRWRIRGESRRDLPAFTDGFGNLAHCHSVNRRHSNAAIFVEGEVETRDTDGIIRGAVETLPPLFFLRETPLTTPSPEIRDLANETARGATMIDRMTSLMLAIHDKIIWRPGITDAKTSAGEALILGTGVCQDHAHVFIAAARGLGIPARYVGGYLWTGKEVGEYEASHAWAEALVPDHGWVSFDPSNRTRSTEAHIRTAIGLDYWSAAPVRGIWRGDAEEKLAVKVQVTRTGADQGADQQ